MLWLQSERQIIICQSLIVFSERGQDDGKNIVRIEKIPARQNDLPAHLLSFNELSCPVGCNRIVKVGRSLACRARHRNSSCGHENRIHPILCAATLSSGATLSSISTSARAIDFVGALFECNSEPAKTGIKHRTH